MNNSKQFHNWQQLIKWSAKETNQLFELNVKEDPICIFTVVPALHDRQQQL